MFALYALSWKVVFTRSLSIQKNLEGENGSEEKKEAKREWKRRQTR